MKPARRKKTVARSNRAGRPGISPGRRVTAKFESRHQLLATFAGTGTGYRKYESVARTRRRVPVSALSPAGLFLGGRGSIHRCDSINDRRRGRHNKKQHDYSENDDVRAKIRSSTYSFARGCLVTRTADTIAEFRDETRKRHADDNPFRWGGALGRDSRVRAIVAFTVYCITPPPPRFSPSLSRLPHRSFARNFTRSEVRRNSTRRNAARALRAVAAVGRGPLPRRASRIVG